MTGVEGHGYDLSRGARAQVERVRVGLFIAGILITLMGVGWALQGAYLLPATFMRGPEWIAIGGGVAAVGALLLWRSFAAKKPAEPPATPSP